VPSPSFEGPPYVSRMLTLPNGQILWSDATTQLYVYTPDGSPDAAWKPAITDITANADGAYLLTGTQLNGISEGAAYGDDAEMSSNYPIVQLTDAHGRVYDARTFNWSNTGVATGATPVTTEFTLPAGTPTGNYSLTVVANGIASDPVSFTVPPTRRGIGAVPVQVGTPLGPDFTPPAVPETPTFNGPDSPGVVAAASPASVTAADRAAGGPVSEAVRDWTFAKLPLGTALESSESLWNAEAIGGPQTVEVG